MNNNLVVDKGTDNRGILFSSAFENVEFGNVRVFLINGEVWMVGNDVAKALGYSRPTDAVAAHVDSEDRMVVQMSDIQVYGDSPLPDHMKGAKIVLINESGFYSLCLRSKLPRAREFKHWVTAIVIPSIRQNGYYGVRPVEDHRVITDEEYNMRMREADAKIAAANAEMKRLDKEMAELMLSIKERTSIPEVAQVADAYAMRILTGKDVVALPEVNQKTYSATDIGKILGVSSNKIGRLAQSNGMKTEEYGKFFYDKAKHCNKEVETFRYYENAIDKFRELLKKG